MLKSFFSKLENTVEKRKARLTALEYVRIKDELKYIETNIDAFEDLQSLIMAVGKHFIPFYSDPRACLIRLHEVATVGTLSSCLTSLPIVQSMYDTGLMNATGIHNKNIIIGRGHIAAAFYAVRHVNGGFPLCFLMTVHQAVPAVVNKEWGFTNTMRHSLGEGLPMAVGRAMFVSERDKPIVCFVGDGEMDEGVSMEALRIAYTNDVTNLIVLIDDNGSGIAQQLKPMNKTYLESVFTQVIELENPEPQIISEVLLKAQLHKGRTAILCKTIKGLHAFKPLSMAKNKVKSTCSKVAGIIEELRMFKRCHVVTADLAARFGFKNNSQCFNLGLSEQASIGMLMALPDDDIKIVLTDDKYFYNSIDLILSAFATCKNLHIIAARKNNTWGGHINSPNVFTAAIEGSVYEFVDPEMLQDKIQQKIKNNSNGFYLINDIPETKLLALRDCYSQICNDALYRFKHNANTLIITAESVSYDVAELFGKYEFSHLRLTNRRPVIMIQLSQLIMQYEKIIVIEYADHKAGLGEYLISQLCISIDVLALTGYEEPCIETRKKDLLENLKNRLDINKESICA